MAVTDHKSTSSESLKCLDPKHVSVYSLRHDLVHIIRAYFSLGFLLNVGDGNQKSERLVGKGYVYTPVVFCCVDIGQAGLPPHFYACYCVEALDMHTYQCEESEPRQKKKKWYTYPGGKNLNHSCFLNVLEYNKST